MNRIFDGNFEDSKCYFCGDPQLFELKVKVQNEPNGEVQELDAKVCEKCRAVFANTHDNGMNFMGFLPQEALIKLYTVLNPCITAKAISQPIDPELN